MNQYSSCWEILEISPTKDKQEIKKAYAKKVTIYHPEDYPEEFKQVQTAYKSAIHYASSADSQDIHYHYTDDVNTTITSSKIENRNVDLVNNKNPHAILPYINQLIEVSIEGTIIPIEMESFYNEQSIKSYKNFFLQQLKVININNPKEEDFINFFNQSEVQLLLEDTSFKNSIDSILRRNYKKYDINCLYYLKDISGKYQLKKFNKAVTMKKEMSMLFPIFLMLIFYCIIMPILNNQGYMISNEQSFLLILSTSLFSISIIIRIMRNHKRNKK